MTIPMLNKQLIALEQKLGSSILNKIEEPFIE